jgi:hypothetical protein
MLYIDPNLHNPKINGIPLIVDNRINPDIAINRDDIVAGDGIVIDKYPDGSIKISANVNGIVSGDSDKYTDIWNIDFMSSLPSVLFKYLVTLFDGLDVEVFFVRDYSLSKHNKDLSPGASCSFDVNGLQKSGEHDLITGQTVCSVELLDNNSELGQGVYFTFEDNPQLLHDVEIYRSNSSSNYINVFRSTIFSNNYFKSFDKINSGEYYWTVTDTDRYTFEKREPAFGFIDFTWEEPKWPEYAAPKNMSSNEFAEWIVSDSYTYNANDSYLAFTDNANEYCSIYGSYDSPAWISWKNKENKVLIRTIEITLHTQSMSLGSFALEGRNNDNENWTEIGSFTGTFGSYGDSNRTGRFTINNDTAYYQHRIICSAQTYSSISISSIKAWRD